MTKDRNRQIPEAPARDRGEEENIDAGPESPRDDNGADTVADDPESPRDDDGADTVADAPESLPVEIQRRLDEANDRELRARAELDNTRKRAGKEIERVRQYALESFASALLGVKDNLERSLASRENADAGDRNEAVVPDNIHEGVRLTLKSLQQVFSDFGIEEVAPLEQSFDPELHQAISTCPTADYPPNTVIELIQKGYTLNGRLLRAAMVVVAAAPDDAATAAVKDSGAAAEGAGTNADKGSGADKKGADDGNGRGEDASRA